ncbi:MAG: hypothetical protein ACOZBH_01970 [Patescibacteria group bacterium]
MSSTSFKVVALVTCVSFFFVACGSSSSTTRRSSASAGYNGNVTLDPVQQDLRECEARIMSGLANGQMTRLNSGRICRNAAGTPHVQLRKEEYVEGNGPVVREWRSENLQPVPFPSPSSSFQEEEQIEDDSSVWDWLGPVLIATAVLSTTAALIWAAETCRLSPCVEYHRGVSQQNGLTAFHF